jgi:hypothetical protein
VPNEFQRSSGTAGEAPDEQHRASGAADDNTNQAQRATDVADEASGTTQQTSGAHVSIDGIWSDPPPDGVQLVHHACTSTECVVGGLRDIVPLLYRFRPGRPLLPFHAVPPPERYGTDWDDLHFDLGEVEPWIATDPGGEQFAVTRTEMQGGSYGIVVYPEYESSRVEIIDSTTDSDITFGRPHILRGDELFTLESPGGHGASLWQFRRQAGQWSPFPVPLPRGYDTDIAWDLVLSDDTSELFIVSSDQGPRIERFSRDKSGTFQHDGFIQLPAMAGIAGFAGSDLMVVFYERLADGSSAWLLDPRTGETRRALTLPVNGNPHGAIEAKVRDEYVLVSLRQTAYVVSLLPGGPVCDLNIPPFENGRFAEPNAVFMGHFAVVMCNNRMGVFDLRRCTP